MKRRIMPVLTALVLCLLCGCAPSEKATSTDPAATPGDGAPVSASDGQAGLPEACESAALYDDGTVSLRLLYGTNDKSGQKQLVLRAENAGDSPTVARLDSPVLNGAVPAGVWYRQLEPGSVVFEKMADWGKSLFLAEEEPLRSVSGQASLSRDYSGDPYAEAEFRADFQNGGAGFFCDRLLNAEIPRQVLLDGDACRLTLLFFGRDPLFSGSFRGMLFAENKTDADLPVNLNGITVNDRTLQIYGSSKTVPAGDVLFYEFTCSDDVLEAQRIESVRSVSLLILTNSADNTGTAFSKAGGSWYPLTVADPDKSPEPPLEEGTVLMDKNGVRIRLLDEAPQKKETFGDKAYYWWELFVENGSDGNIEIDFVDWQRDGQTDTGVLSEPSVNCEIAAGAGSFCRFSSGELSADAPCPSITGRFRVYELGRSRILFESDPVVFPN